MGWSSAQSLPWQPLRRVPPTAFSGSGLHSPERVAGWGCPLFSAFPCQTTIGRFPHAHQPFWGLPFPSNDDLIPKCSVKGAPIQISGTAFLSPSPYKVRFLSQDWESAECKATQLTHPMSRSLPRLSRPAPVSSDISIAPRTEVEDSERQDFLGDCNVVFLSF